MKIANAIAAFVYTLGMIACVGMYIDAWLLTKDAAIDRQDRITAWLMVLTTLLLTFGLAFSIPWLASNVLRLT